MPAPIEGVRPRRGRPRKFPVPSRAVTLTLPENVIAALTAVDADLSLAVARVMQPRLAEGPHAPAELSVFGRRAVIVVHPSRRLERQIGVELVPLPDGRALISFDHPMTISQIELMLRDAIDRGGLPSDDRPTFVAIADILSSTRRSERVTLRQRSIIVLEASRGAVGRKPPKRTLRGGRKSASKGRVPA